MLDFQIPRITSESVEQNRGTFTIEPLDRGFGYTFGNSLRRVLLSSLAGAAVTSVRIEGVAHVRDRLNLAHAGRADVERGLLGRGQRAQRDHEALDITMRDLEHILYFETFVCIDPGEVMELKEKDIIPEDKLRELQKEHLGKFTAGMGAEAIKELLRRTRLTVANEVAAKVLSKHTVGSVRDYLTRKVREVWPDVTLVDTSK